MWPCLIREFFVALLPVESIAWWLSAGEFSSCEILFDLPRTALNGKDTERQIKEWFLQPEGM